MLYSKRTYVLRCLRMTRYFAKGQPLIQATSHRLARRGASSTSPLDIVLCYIFYYPRFSPVRRGYPMPMLVFQGDEVVFLGGRGYHPAILTRRPSWLALSLRLLRMRCRTSQGHTRPWGDCRSKGRAASNPNIRGRRCLRLCRHYTKMI